MEAMKQESCLAQYKSTRPKGWIFQGLAGLKAVFRVVSDWSRFGRSFTNSPIAGCQCWLNPKKSISVIAWSGVQ